MRSDSGAARGLDAFRPVQFPSRSTSWAALSAVRVSELDGMVSGMETPMAPDSGDEEHAVIAYFRLAGDGFGDVDQRERIYDAAQAMEAASEEAGVGEVDGNEFGGGEAAVYAYGPDADALFTVLEPVLRSVPFRPAHVVLRRDDNETRRVDL
ncbi:hypothetical protein [Streptomyces rishiriensis]|uniref:Uncharacterized protein n=1 Tax=Streptomyces rishiriensis TaxID=68264 RepID=A0ABU0NTI9_STRRH|nr:hypothetical protein [Streptomyces rishiriensis]MDQ0582486.1 hypothetical protein [Streptomyces rishiriensis]